MVLHEDKLRRFAPFAHADERFVAALTTKLRPEVYMPEAYVLVSGQVYSGAYFISRGLVQVTWPAEERDTVNVITIDDYFGELSLFVTRKLAYTVRSITHLDAFRLERNDLQGCMRSYPAGAVHVADLMESVLPQKLAAQVTREIYDHSGLRELLSVLQPGSSKWRPLRGLAERLRRFAAEHEVTLARIRTKVQVENRATPTASHTKTNGGSSGAARPGSGEGNQLRSQLVALTKSQVRLSLRTSACRNSL